MYLTPTYEEGLEFSKYLHILSIPHDAKSHEESYITHPIRYCGRHVIFEKTEPAKMLKLSDIEIMALEVID